MVDTPEFLAERLLTEGEKSINFFLALTPEELGKTIYTEGAHWTALKVLAHFVTSEYSLFRLVENIASGGGGSPEHFDVDGYNERKVAELENASLEELVQKFRENRNKTATLVARIKAEDLVRQGRHPFLGMAPLAEIIKIIYRHNQVHLREIRQVLKTL